MSQNQTILVLVVHHPQLICNVRAICLMFLWLIKKRDTILAAVKDSYWVENVASDIPLIVIGSYAM